MQILVTGSSGLVGSRFVELYPNKSELLTPDRHELDIASESSVFAYYKKHHPDTVIHFAAYTDVAASENQRGNKNGLCWQINVVGTQNLISVTSPHIHFIYISSDMVFPGNAARKGPYSESDQPESDPDLVTWYGFCKSAAEKLIPSRGTILRLIYPVRAHFTTKLDYLRKPLQLFQDHKLYPLFFDQQMSISFIDEIFLTLQKIISSHQSGFFHAGSSDLTTPFEIISYLLEKKFGEKNAVIPSSISNVANPVRYPQFGGLLVAQTEQQLGIKFSSWRQVVEQLIDQGISV